MLPPSNKTPVVRKDKTRIKVARPFASVSVDLAVLHRALREWLNDRCIAITMLYSDVWHWTVITKATEKTLRLFDSDGSNAV